MATPLLFVFLEQDIQDIAGELPRAPALTKCERQSHREEDCMPIAFETIKEFVSQNALSIFLGTLFFAFFSLPVIIKEIQRRRQNNIPLEEIARRDRH